MSDVHETAVAKASGGRRTKNSGAGRMKGDVHNAVAVFECKSTFDDVFSVSSGLLDSITREAAVHDKIPVLSLARLSGNLSQPASIEIRHLLYLYPDADLRIKTFVKSYRHAFEDPPERPRRIGFRTRLGVPLTWTLSWELPNHLHKPLLNEKPRRKRNSKPSSNVKESTMKFE